LVGDDELVRIDEGDPVELGAVGFAGGLIGENLRAGRAVRPIVEADIVEPSGRLDDRRCCVIGTVIEDDLCIEPDQRMERDPFRNIERLVTNDQANGGLHELLVL
jgi:hypothetical protein